VNNVEGIMGQVQEFPLNDLARLATYQPPFELAGKGFENVDETIKTNADKFILGHAGTLFHRMNWLREPQQLYIDLLEESKEFLLIRDMIHEYNMRFLDCLLQHEYDGIGFSDDWGSQNALLISPPLWRKLFKPLYQEIFQRIKEHDMLVFFHTDGYVIDIIDDLIEIGVDALNCQVACMGVEKLGKRFRRRVCFWGEIDRQKILPHGTPEQVRAEIEKTLQHLCTPEGGCIFQAELNADVPFGNVEAMFETWDRLATAHRNLV
jgi:uroporphyrinogen decarboxylase